VLDASQRSALAVVRSLGKKNMHVVAADHMSSPLAGASRYVRETVCYADPSREPTRFLEDVGTIVRRFDIDIVIPTTDLTSMLLVHEPGAVGKARLAAPAQDSYERLTDKGTLVASARELGLAVPTTRLASGRAQIEAAAAEFGYPVVLKPTRSRYRKGDRIISTAVSIVRTARDLPALLEKLHWLEDLPCLVQQFIPGYGAGIFALHGGDQPIAWFAHRRIREKPPSGGVSVVSESVAIDPRMQAAASKLLAAARWRGIAMVEFRVASDGTAHIMEVNGRFWGSLQLAIDSGIDFPWLLLQLIADTAAPSPPVSYQHGRRLRWVLGDVDNLLLQIRSSELSGGKKLLALGRFLGSSMDLACQQEVFRWQDPKPAWREARDWVAGVLQ
jgi:predicted ATP-grasp superfamily ATP-dependent carboligase